LRALDELRLEKAKFIQFLKLLAEGLGARGTARVTKLWSAHGLNSLKTIGQLLPAGPPPRRANGSMRGTDRPNGMGPCPEQLAQHFPKTISAITHG
jgi:hypothetical protein